MTCPLYVNMCVIFLVNNRNPPMFIGRDMKSPLYA